MQTRKLLEQLDLAMATLAAVRLAIEESQPAPAANIAKEEAEGICHFCKKPLGDEKGVRGCHQRCNQAMNRAKKAGETTDSELMASGRIGPAKPAGRKRKTSVRQILDAQAKATEKADAAREQAQVKRSRTGGSNS